jgi:hypothetical protein
MSYSTPFGLIYNTKAFFANLVSNVPHISTGKNIFPMLYSITTFNARGSI